MEAPTVKVKPLVWDRHPDADFDPTCNEHYGGGQNNLAGVNEYGVFPHPCAVGMFVLDVMGNRCEDDFPSVEAAKAAAQADYEARILSAIDTTDLEAHIGVALAEAADEGPAERLRAYLKARDACDYDDDELDYIVGETAEDVARLSAADISAILASHSTAFTALDRAKREAREEGIEAAAKPLTDAEAASICLTYRHDFGLLPPRDREAMIRQAKAWHDAMRHHFRALIEKEGKP